MHDLYLVQLSRCRREVVRTKVLYHTVDYVDAMGHMESFIARALAVKYLEGLKYSPMVYQNPLASVQQCIAEMVGTAMGG